MILIPGFARLLPAVRAGLVSHTQASDGMPSLNKIYTARESKSRIFLSQTMSDRTVQGLNRMLQLE